MKIDQHNDDCPNCWGYQEYQNEQVTPKIKVLKRIGWIDAYIRKHISI